MATRRDRRQEPNKRKGKTMATRRGRDRREETEVKRVCSGSRRKMGTDWPIETILYRRGKPLVPGDSEKSKPWKVVFNLCNGVPTSTRFYRTKKEALEALD